MTRERRLELRDEVKQLWDHGYGSYMTFAYPHDELKPITCQGQSRDVEFPGNYARNDVNGNYAVTHLDVLSTLPLMHGRKEFRQAIDRALRDTNFDQDVKVQVFEVTIRVLGSLLSSYQQLVDMEAEEALAHTDFEPPQGKKKDGLIRNWLGLDRTTVDLNRTRTVPPRSAKERRIIKQALLAKPSQRAQKLLRLALDLGDRLMPAFDTPTGLPYARVNLKHGIEPNEDSSTCSAAAASLTLEFTLLSRLSGDPKFEAAARKAFMAVWERRSLLNLIGNTINVQTGHWYAPGQSGIGAGIDSMYEYALKSSVMIDDDGFMDIWEDAYAAVMQHHLSNDGYFHRNVHVTLGSPLNNLVDSLSAFWPGLQVLAGDVENAVKSHLFYWKLWEKHSAMPEAFNYINKTAEWHGYPLRPEAIESTYHLYQATKDDFYLDVGERMLKDLNRRTKTHCGFAVLHDVFTGKREDRMESFMLSETLKYLYLLFDAENPINKEDSGTVFTTEGHRLRIPFSMRPKHSLKSSQYKQQEFANTNYQCPAYNPFTANGLRVGIRRRPDYDYVSTLVDMPLIKDEGYWSHDAECLLPSRKPHHFEISLSQDTTVPDKSSVVRRGNGHIYVDDMRGVKGRVTLSIGSKSYDLTSGGPFTVQGLRVRPGQSVIVTDPEVISQWHGQPEGHRRQSLSMVDRADEPVEIVVKFSASPRMTVPDQSTYEPVLETFASTAVFGRTMAPSDLDDAAKDTSRPFMGLHQNWLPLLQPVLDNHGCADALYTNPPYSPDFIALVRRGGCAFFEKLLTAKQHGALGVVIWGLQEDGDQLVRPSAEGDPAEQVEDVGIVYIPYEAGKSIADRLEGGEEMGVAFGAVEYDELDMTSLADLLTQQQEELQSILEELDLDHLTESLQNVGGLENGSDVVPDEVVQVLASMDTTKKLLADAGHNHTATEPFADVEEAPPTPIPANVLLAGLPITNLFIIPPR